MSKTVRWEFKQLTASYAKRFVEKHLTPGMDSGDWSMCDTETGLIYVCPRPNKSFDIRPDWTVIKAEHICVCDIDGNLVEDNGFLPTVELPMHLAIYRARPEIHAIVHGHPLYSSAFAVTGEDIPFLLAESGIFLGGSVPCAKYGLVGFRGAGRVHSRGARQGQACRAAAQPRLRCPRYGFGGSLHPCGFCRARCAGRLHGKGRRHADRAVNGQLD